MRALADLVRKKRRRLRRYHRLASAVRLAPYRDVVHAIIADERRHLRELDRATAAARRRTATTPVPRARPRLRLQYVLPEPVAWSWRG